MWILLIVAAGLAGLIVYDLVQRKHAILRNFPIIGHFRYWLEAVGPELRQYIVTDNDEERPFSRDQRRWIYASSKQENNYFGFGSDNDMELTPNYVVIKHSAFPFPETAAGDPYGAPHYRLPCAKVLGEYRHRPKAFRPDSIVNVSGMSFGSLSGRAVEALNRGCARAGCLHNSGEGGISPYHLHGADVVWQVGTGYFGCRNDHGRFSLAKLVETTTRHERIRAIEIKLSQGAKPGLGGILPAAKVTREIAAARGVPVGTDCVSPAAHHEFHNVDRLLDFIERVADATGLPTGIKSAVGDLGFWDELARLAATTNRAPDFIAVDGGEGGTGAGPLAFTDHVAMPFKLGFSQVYRALARYELHERIVMIGSGRLGLPENALLAFALGCDMIAVGREAMMAIGCIQAQRCHTGHCPTGVTTHNRWLVLGLDPPVKGERLANYVITLRKEMGRLSRACGVPHPALVSPADLEIIDDRFHARTIEQVFGYPPGLGLPSPGDQEAVRSMMAAAATAPLASGTSPPESFH